MSREFELHLVADADGARAAALAVRGMLERVDPLVAGACELAVIEACANVVVHAYGGEGGELRVILRLRNERFSAAVCDAGPPFDATRTAESLSHETAEGGRGLALLGMCMDRLDWRRVDGENRLLMTRSLREAA
jgi:anti-sigma regulatory factor (Ser/Thr protein kinase)